ncbi:peroxiredoxin [Patescibacteria group bacterium]|nr:peroxiredoxin [Patescibacteria group bacterium]
MVDLLDTVVSYTNPQCVTEEIGMKDLLNQADYTVLYFYPKDNTPGCTIEAKEFSQHVKDFIKVKSQIIGVSKDTGKSHCKFQQNHELNI